MAYYVRIGHIPMNPRGIGARGWQAFRRGRMVTVRYGKVVVKGAGRSRIYWSGPHWPREQEKRCRSVEAAKAYLSALVRDKRSNQKYRGGAYERLPPGRVIRKSAG